MIKKEGKVWIPRPYDALLVERLAKQTGLPPMVAQLFAGRNIIDPAEINAFLAPANLAKGLYPPERLPGCTESAVHLLKAIRDGKKITVYGDYDVDGMTATAILVEAIGVLGGSVSYFVPNRLEEGYGLNCDSLRRLKEGGTDLVVTVDCGITSLEEARFAKEIGIELVVTDHHTPITDPESGRQILPDVLSITHPRLVMEGIPPYPCPELCGAAVALKLAWALGKGVEGKPLVGERMREFLIRAVGLAALGTVADVVSLRDENRTIVRFGLAKSLQDSLPMGLALLIEAAGLNQYHKKITSEDIGFSIAPRLNAAGREVLHESSRKDEDDEKNWKIAKSLFENPDRLAAAGQMGLASLGVELLVTDRIDRARELAPFINNLNETRQKLERRIMHEALRQIEADYQDAPAFVLASRDWHPGVIGIVAGRLAERFHRPAVMIALKNTDPGTGSGRGIPDSDFSLYAAFDHCRDYLERFGGHDAAAGLGINEANIPAFRKEFCNYVLEHLSDQSQVPKLRIDGEFPLSAFTQQSIAAIDRMAPFGADNPRPVFVSYGVALSGPARRVGAKIRSRDPSDKTTEPLGRTFSAKFRQFRDERRAVAFGQGDWADEMNALCEADPSVTFDIAFHVMYNDYYGQIELRLADWRVSEK